MPLELIQGPPNSGRAGAMLARVRADLDREPVLVVPTADDVAAFERELCDGPGAALGASITTFAGLAREVSRRLAIELDPPLSEIERQALIRAAIRGSSPNVLRRSAARPGFTLATDRLIAELQAALVSADDFARLAATLDDGVYEVELAAIYSGYCELRDRARRSDESAITAAATGGLAIDPSAWNERPVFLYGFDDLARDQLDLLAALGRTAPVVVAVTYADTRALSAQASLVTALEDEYGAVTVERLDFDPTYTSSATLRHLDRHLFDPDAVKIDLDEGLTLLDSAGARGEAEAIGVEIARLIDAGYEPDEIAIVVRHPDSAGPILASVLANLGVPVALEASVPISETTVGTSLVALCRAAADERAVGELITHLRTDPSLDPRTVDWVERRVRRGQADSVSAATERWEKPPRHLERLRTAQTEEGRLRALARSARELAEGAHRERAPLAGRSGAADEVPFSALELRAGVAAAELLGELAEVGSLSQVAAPALEQAVEALQAATIPRWRGPAAGRVRIMSPYRARAARARALFCAGLQDGEFPSSTPPDPLLSEGRRSELGHRDLRRADQALEERYLFHACVSRPTERLYLSWRSCDEDGAALARSPFVDEVLDLVDAEGAARARAIQVRGPELAVLAPDEATTPRLLARSIALAGWQADRPELLDRLGVHGLAAQQTLDAFAGLPDPDFLPGPLRNPAVLEEMAARRTFSARSLEGWVTCSYRWFVDHELRPQQLEPSVDAMWLGSVVHAALWRLYADPPGEDAIPRPGDVGRWRARFAELVDEITTAEKTSVSRARRAALERARVQIETFLEREAESETEFRPARELLEIGFGELDHVEEGEEPAHEPLRLGEIELRGRVDRVDVASDGRSAIVHDYKTGKRVSSADKFGDNGTLQIQLYMLVAQRVLGLDPVAGLYQPLGAAAPDKRKPRGLASGDDERVARLGLVRTDVKPGAEVEEMLAIAERRALDAAEAMRAGRIARDPLNGECPRYCTFQPICRLERALGAVGDESTGTGDDS